MWFIWIAFIVLVLGLLAMDLGVFHRKSHAIGMREALGWTAFWLCLSLSFTGVVYALYQYHLWGFGTNLDPYFPHDGWQAAQTFLAGYLLEQSLSIDNIFVIAIVITFFKVPPLHQHRVLFWGILGALIMRGIMIAIGTALVNWFWWTPYLFGVLLIATALKLLFHSDEDVDPEHNYLVRVARRIYPVTPHYDGAKFVSRLEGRRAITPLFLCVLVIESTDLLFAVDSIPAVIAMTRDPFLVFTSNVFAILGLRSLYFALAGMMDKFRYLKYSLVVLLMFIGAKMLTDGLVKKYTGEHLPIGVSLIAIAGVLGVGIAASLVANRSEQILRVAAYMGAPAWRYFRRLVIFVVGSTVVLIGVVMILSPGPAILVIPLGLLILSTEFVWAKRLLDKVKARIKSAAGYAEAPEPGPPPNCEKCGYSLRGLTEPRCPECGQPFASPPESANGAPH